MSDDKPSGTSQTVVSNDPWEGQRPFLTEGFERASGLLDNPVGFYPNSTVVPFHGATTDALGRAEDRARSGSDLSRAGMATMQDAVTGQYRGGSPSAGGFAAFGAGDTMPQQQMADTASGQYLNSNPHLQTIIDRSIADSSKAVDARFSRSGRYGSGHHAGTVADRAGDISASIRAPAYESERNRMTAAQSQLAGSQLSGLQGGQDIYSGEIDTQLKAAAGAPAMAQTDYADIERLGGVGGAHEGQATAELQDQIQRFAFDQTSPRDALREYMALVGGGSYGGTTTSAEPIYSNPFGEALGYAGTAAGLAGNLFGAEGAFPGGWWGS